MVLADFSSRPHAEIYALRDAGAVVTLEPSATRWSVSNADHLRNATVYVTLEPCSHIGRTPPCCDALVDVGVRRVVIGIKDPAPWVSGRGIDRLRKNGIRVDVGVEASVCTAINAQWIKNVTTPPPPPRSSSGSTS